MFYCISIWNDKSFVFNKKQRKQKICFVLIEVKKEATLDERETNCLLNDTRKWNKNAYNENACIINFVMRH